jgi:hypothetical protein
MAIMYELAPRLRGLDGAAVHALAVTHAHADHQESVDVSTVVGECSVVVVGGAQIPMARLVALSRVCVPIHSRD